jgi:hypothetical protein
MSTTIRAELIWDEEAQNWHFRVPALHISGGGNPTREEAQRFLITCADTAAEHWIRNRASGRSTRPQHFLYSKVLGDGA